MSTSVAVTHTQGRTRLTALRKVMIAALIANVLAHAYLQMVILHTLIPPLAVIMVLTLLVAGVCATRWRWAPLLGALWCVASVIPGLEPYAFNLTHPTALAVFAETLLTLALLFIVVVAGIAATIQGDRQAADAIAPRWLRSFLASVATFVLNAVLVAAIPQPAATAGVSPAVLAGLPAVTTANYQFDQPEIKAKVGENVALRLHNSDAAAHSFDIDAFDVHVPMAGGTDSLALFRPNTPGTYTFYCSIPGHTEAGMKGTLIVKL
jgi:heme/copper-type cytochrome/quinol oxidase subunit 2